MAAKKQKQDFEQGLAALESLVARMEGDMPLNEAMKAYEEGVKLYEALAMQLDESEKRLRVLAGEDNEDGADGVNKEAQP